MLFLRVLRKALSRKNLNVDLDSKSSRILQSPGTCYLEIDVFVNIATCLANLYVFDLSLIIQLQHSSIGIL